MNKDNELRLLAGMPIQLGDNVLIHSPKVRDVAEIGESTYNRYLSALLFNKRNIEGEIPAHLHDFDVLIEVIQHNEMFRMMFFSALKFVCQAEPQICTDQEGQSVAFYFATKDDWTLNKKSFHHFQECIRISNHMKKSDEDEYVAYNEQAAELMKFLEEERKNKPKPKETVNLHSIISGLAWKAQGLNILNLFDLTMYQLYDGFKRLERIDNYFFTLSGIYSGNVDGKKINFHNIHWTQIIES